MHSDKEIVICSAVLEEDGTVIRGHRHIDCYLAIQRRGNKPNESMDGEGFVTSRNRFVDRKNGLLLQQSAGIESTTTEGYSESMLFSEDLY